MVDVEQASCLVRANFFCGAFYASRRYRYGMSAAERGASIACASIRLADAEQSCSHRYCACVCCVQRRSRRCTPTR